MHVKMTTVESACYCFEITFSSNQTLKDDSSKNPGSWFQEISFEDQCSPNFYCWVLQIISNANTTIRNQFRFLSGNFLVELCFPKLLFRLTLNANVYSPPYFVYLRWSLHFISFHANYSFSTPLVENSVNFLLKSGFLNSRGFLRK